MGEFTYEHLFDTLRKERSREELQELDPDFYVRCQAYIATESEKLRHEDVLSAGGDRLRMQVQNAKKLLKELYDRREKKIMLLALNKARTGSSIIDTSALLQAELELYTLILSQLTRFRDLIDSMQAAPEMDIKEPLRAPLPLRPTPSEQPATEPTAAPVNSPLGAESSASEAGELSRLRALTSIPKFLGGQNMSFGPFEQGDELAVPQRIARILIKKGRAEPLEATPEQAL